MNTVEEIKAHLSHGDYVKIAKAVGVSRNYALKLLNRPGAAKHEAVKDAAEKIAEVNKQFGL